MATILEGTTGARSRTSARGLGGLVGRIPSKGGPSSSRISPFPGSTDPYATFPRYSNRAIFMGSHPQYRKHVVEAGRFPDHPRRGPPPSFMSLPSAPATTSAILTAVPEGESFLNR